MFKETAFICTLTTEEQATIRELLIFAGITGDDLELAMNSRVCDLEEVIFSE